MKNKKKSSRETLSFFERCDAFFSKYDLAWFWILFGVTLVTSLMLFDPRVSAGGDDSEYILSARAFFKEFKFPGYQGPLYPIVLSIPGALFGMSLTALKSFSMVAMLACMFFMFLAFRRRIPSTLLFITLLLTSINSHVLYFTSQTYSETFYMFMQALLLFVFFRLFIDRENGDKLAVSAELKRHLLLAVTLLGAILTRSVGYTLFLAVVGYFLVYKQWKNIGWFAGAFLLCFGAYQLLKYALWGDASIQASGQGASLLYKDFYKPEYGHEDFWGFIDRLWVNSNQYLSRFFAAMLGVRDTFTPQGVFVNVKPGITLLVYLLGLTGIWFSYKQNKYLLFSGFAVGLFLVVTFVILQTNWNQFRLIVPAYPLMILLLFTALYYILSLPRFRSYQFLLFVPAVVLFFTILSDTAEAAEKAGKLKNEYSGLTPDWLHYAKASAWAGGNLPEDALVACRKPSISSAYAKGRKFYGIYRVVSGNIDAFYERWKADSSAFAVIPTEGMTNEIYMSMYGHCEARLLLGQAYYLAVSDPAFVRELAGRWPKLQIVYSPRDLKPVMDKAGDETAVYYADSLLAPLRQNNVTHVLSASLRLNPNIKDGQTINTVERVIAFIAEKYPSIMTQIKRFGEPNDEPAEIYQINWEAVKD